MENSAFQDTKQRKLKPSEELFVNSIPQSWIKVRLFAALSKSSCLLYHYHNGKSEVIR